jgi:hypothetical protein
VCRSDISNTQYLSMLQNIQTSSPLQLWVGAPAFALDIPDPIEIGSAVQSTIANMTSHGMPADAPLFFMGHSLGSTMLQLYLASAPVKAAGMVRVST